MEQLAIIKDVNVGIRDVGYPICWFSVEMIAGGALIVITIKEMEKILKDHSIYKLQDLNNKPCIVETNGNIVKFLRVK